ncbi:hypothetical protein JCM17845_16930 [Iodidimonas gelatinilytica]|uniref:Uncharacterized protein n=2 Tax=Iodidimonas gelatinilytica TaxID=1236966 RepID=A0A5A7N152_9PROT|nr:hypothetical protein JCM17845_16930 [Iodidimonas gelatinilytica]
MHDMVLARRNGWKPEELIFYDIHESDALIQIEGPMHEKTSTTARRKENKWLRSMHDGQWPHAIDLARDIGGKSWWAGFGALCAGLLFSVMLGLWTPSGSGNLKSQTAATDNEAPNDSAMMPFAANISAAPPPLLTAALTDTPSEIVASVHHGASLDQPAPPAAAQSITIGRGDTMIDALIKGGTNRIEAHNAITALSKLFDMRRLRIGQVVDLTFAPHEGDKTLSRLAVRTRFDERVVAQRDDDGQFHAKREPLPITPLLAYGSGTIDDSLYLAAQRAGVPAKVILELILLYSFDVDFQREIRSGDRFEILYRRDVAQEDGAVEDGAILFARLNLRGRDLPLYRHMPADSDNWDYFNEDGKSVRKALMKTPLDGARLTSRFGKRKHPVLGYVRSHQGADFGAPTGTPVYAAGNGTIERASRFGSYGNYIRIRHNGTYKTAYAHLSKYGRGIKKGVRVKQGQVIGYVGATGRVTGAHLHYEVYVGDKRVDPLTLKLPSGRALDGPFLQSFQEARARIDEDVHALSRANAIVFAAVDK